MVLVDRGFPSARWRVCVDGVSEVWQMGYGYICHSKALKVSGAGITAAMSKSEMTETAIFKARKMQAIQSNTFYIPSLFQYLPSPLLLTIDIYPPNSQSICSFQMSIRPIPGDVLVNN